MNNELIFTSEEKFDIIEYYVLQIQESIEKALKSSEGGAVKYGLILKAYEKIIVFIVDTSHLEKCLDKYYKRLSFESAKILHVNSEQSEIIKALLECNKIISMIYDAFNTMKYSDNA